MRLKLNPDEKHEYFQKILKEHGKPVDFLFKPKLRIYVFRDGYVLRVFDEDGYPVVELEKPGFLKLLKESRLFRLALLYSLALVAVSLASAGLTVAVGLLGALTFSAGLIVVSLIVAVKLYRALKRPFIRLDTISRP